MFFPTQQSRNFQPNHMNHRPANFMLPNRSFNTPQNANNIQNMLSRFIQPQSTAGIVNKGVGGLSKTLNNVQQVLKVVQSSAPIVQEYGPMVKNLPAMYRMMKAFKDIESTDDTEYANDEVETEQNSPQNKQATTSRPVEDKLKNTREGSGQSTPKLYI